MSTMTIRQTFHETAHDERGRRVLCAPLATELREARERTDLLFRILTPDAWYERPIGERHRMIFYLGHLEAFDWNMVARRGLGRPSFHPEFDRLFEFGIDPAEGNLPADTPADWPSLGEVHGYNQRVRAELDAMLDEAPEQIVQVAIEHRWMHAETLAYLLHNMPYEHKRPQPQPALDASAEPARPTMMRIPAGEATLGQSREHFGWDNEFEEHRVAVPAFSIGQYKIANGDYLRFVEADAKPPFFWLRRDGEWFYRGMFELLPLPLDWPVYVTHKEAEAYAKWRGAELPTEAQFHRAAYGSPDGTERSWPWGEDAPSAERGNFDFARWDPAPVTANRAGDSAWGVSQLVGNGWEWTSTPFAPFAGFRTFDFYPRYSAAFFDDDHFVMKGGSPQTARCLLRRSFRNWFRHRYPYVYGTFRLVSHG